MSILTPADKNLFFSKNNPKDPRLGDLVDQELENTFHIIGYPDDEGIKNNGGRVGASLGPDTIRRYLYKMTTDSSTLSIKDLGNLNPSQLDLAARHTQLIAELESTSVNKWVGLGGGHDYAYVDGSRFLKMKHNNKPLIINIDAHLDVRPDTAGINSGTPFYRLKKEYDNNYDMIQIGIQPQCNSLEHINWCHDHNIDIVKIEELQDSPLSLSEYFVKNYPQHIVKNRPCYLSVDIDGFSSSYAPGCSQSWPSGLGYSEVNDFMNMIYKRLDVKCLGVYEVSPPLDFDNLTSRLAALLVYNYLTRN